jgi:hypothetical protein
MAELLRLESAIEWPIRCDKHRLRVLCRLQRQQLAQAHRRERKMRRAASEALTTMVVKVHP